MSMQQRMTVEQYQNLRPTRAYVAGTVEKNQRKPRRDDEHNEQVVFFNRIRALATNDPRYAQAARRTFAIPNGGGRSKSQAGRLKAEGVRPGVSDIFVAVPSGNMHGLWIEMKSLTGYPSREQREWISESIELGYAAVCCRGAGAAFDAWRDFVSTMTEPGRRTGCLRSTSAASTATSLGSTGLWSNPRNQRPA